MNLAFESGLEIADATEGDIRAYLDGEVFSILEASPDTYLQCRKYPWPSYSSSAFKQSRPGRAGSTCQAPPTADLAVPRISSEYQDSASRALSSTIRSAGDYDNLEMVTSCFYKYLAGDESWTDFHWEKVDLAELEASAEED